jgi:hypothetical protein
MGGSPGISFKGEKFVWGLFFKEKTKGREDSRRLWTV